MLLRRLQDARQLLLLEKDRNDKKENQPGYGNAQHVKEPAQTGPPPTLGIRVIKDGFCHSENLISIVSGQAGEVNEIVLLCSAAEPQPKKPHH